MFFFELYFVIFTYQRTRYNTSQKGSQNPALQIYLLPESTIKTHRSINVSEKSCNEIPWKSWDLVSSGDSHHCIHTLSRQARTSCKPLEFINPQPLNSVSFYAMLFGFDSTIWLDIFRDLGKLSTLVHCCSRLSLAHEAPVAVNPQQHEKSLSSSSKKKKNKQNRHKTARTPDLLAGCRHSWLCIPMTTVTTLWRLIWSNKRIKEIMLNMAHVVHQK